MLEQLTDTEVHAIEGIRRSLFESVGEILAVRACSALTVCVSISLEFTQQETDQNLYARSSCLLTQV